MRGDFSRVTFRPENHFSGVLLQQGRVQLDAEFNEQVAIDAYRDRQTTRDVVGPSGAPLDGGGFEVSVASMLRGVGAGKHAWAVGEDGTILQSESGKKRWEIEDDAAKGARLNAVDLGTEDSGWAVGDGATILRLSGAKWKPEPAAKEVTADLHGVHAAATEAWAVGATGLVLAWDGSKWQRQAQDADVVETLRDVHFAGNVGVAVGDGGTILCTTDGKKWKRQPAPAGTGDLHGVFLADAKHGWAVGEQGTVLFFDGKDWTEQELSPRVTATLRAVVMASTTDGVAVGDGGIAVRLHAGSWTETPTMVEADLRALTELDSGAVIAVGDDVAITFTEAWTAAPDMPAGESGPRGRTLTLSAGDIYVEGIRYENERPTSLHHQPEPLLDPLPGGNGEFGVVLHVQEQLLTATEREELREVALGGPDSATRTRSVWQASLVEFDDEQTSGHSCADVAALVPNDGPRGTLRARAKPAAIATSECVVPPNGGYRRLENQLYRLEIHAGTKDTDGAATYVWSRDNGSVIARLEHVSATTTDSGEVRVSRTARGGTVDFGPDQLVEITDTGRMLRGEPGVVGQVGIPQGPTLPLSGLEQAPLSMADFPSNPIVRRWDGTGKVEYGKWIELEAGVFVQFAEGDDPDDAFRTGDYWTIPARTLSGRVEWPQSGGVPRFADRHGPRRERTPLAVVTRAKGIWQGVRDCRKLFPPLTKLVHMYYVGGDGQEAPPPMPLTEGGLVDLDEQLEVGVVNGSTPVEGAIVDWSVYQGDGKVTPDEPTTDGNGMSRCTWQLGSVTRSQIAEARLVDPLGQAPPQVIRFKAQLSFANRVAYDGKDCPALAATQTVQDAIDTLTHLAHITALSGSGEDVLPGESVDVAVVVTSDCAPVAGATVKFVNGPRGTGSISQPSATTDASGKASCTWTPDKTEPTQDLTATLAETPDPVVVNQPAEVRFVANLNLASDTAYKPPTACPEMKGATTVQEAIDRLAGLLPRLYHVSGDGLEGPVGAKILLRAGIANRCGVKDPRVRFERLDDSSPDRPVWAELKVVKPDDDDIATLEYVLNDDPRQFLRARLSDGVDKLVGHPVYFTVSIAAAGGGGEGGERKVPNIRLRAPGQAVGPRAATPVEFETVESGDDELFGPERTQVTVRAPGVYLIVGEVAWPTLADATLRGCALTRNGEAVGRVSGPNSRAVNITQQATTSVRLEAGDIVQLVAAQGNQDEIRLESATLSLAWLSA
jgi:photosystem II stability/assembly factor-like uncharacterized protein